MSVQGEIVSDWKINGQQFSWNISMPPNTTAVAYIPSIEGKTVHMDGKPPGNLKYENGYALTELGSGNYSFTSDFKKQ